MKGIGGVLYLSNNYINCNSVLFWSELRSSRFSLQELRVITARHGRTMSKAFVNQTSGSLLRALRELKRVDEILQAALIPGGWGGRMMKDQLVLDGACFLC